MLLFSGPVTVISNQGHDIWSKYIFAVKIKNVCHIPIITKISEYQIPTISHPNNPSICNQIRKPSFFGKGYNYNPDLLNGLKYFRRKRKD